MGKDYAFEQKGSRKAVAAPLSSYKLTAVMLTVLLCSWYATAAYLPEWGLGSRTLLSLFSAYLPSYLDGSENSGHRYWDAFARHPVWTKGATYFSAAYRVETPLKKGAQYIFTLHPHGGTAISHLAFMSNAIGVHDAFSDGLQRLDLGANVLFKLPGLREMCLWMGVVDATRANAHKVLSSKDKKSLLSMMGGMTEQIYAEPRRAFIYTRPGLFKLALQYGVPIVPAYTFGENETWNSSRALMGVRSWVLKTFRVALPLIWGRKACPLVPLPARMTVCFAEPVPVTKMKVGEQGVTQQDFDQEVQRLHALYVANVQKVYAKHAEDLGYKDVKLQLMGMAAPLVTR